MKKYLIALPLFISFSVLACLHYPQDYKETITENLKEFFLFNDNRGLHIIAKTNLQSTGELPKRLAWVFPLPALPKSYAEVSPKIFEEIHKLNMKQLSEGRGFPKSKGANALDLASSIQVHESKQVGRYKVTPIEIKEVTANTSSALDHWLTKNNFKGMPRDRQLQYLKKGHVFLAIEADLSGTTTASFKPLHITLPKQSSYSLPLGLTHEERSFEVQILTLGLKLNDAAKSTFYTAHTDKFIYPNKLVSTPELKQLLKGLKGHIVKWQGKVDGKDLPADPVFQIAP